MAALLLIALLAISSAPTESAVPSYAPTATSYEPSTGNFELELEDTCAYDPNKCGTNNCNMGFVQEEERVYMCGNYCGPNYVRGIECQESKAFGSLKLDQLVGLNDIPMDALDACCQKHDYCCHHLTEDGLYFIWDGKSTTSCNDEMHKCAKDIPIDSLPVVSVGGGCNRGIHQATIKYFGNYWVSGDGSCFSYNPAFLGAGQTAADDKNAEYDKTEDRLWTLNIKSTRGPLKLVGRGGAQGCPDGDEYFVPGCDNQDCKGILISGAVPGNLCTKEDSNPSYNTNDLHCVPNDPSVCKFDVFAAADELGFQCPDGFTCDLSCAAIYEGFDHFTCENAGVGYCCIASGDVPPFRCPANTYCDIDCAMRSGQNQCFANLCCKEKKEELLGTIAVWWNRGNLWDTLDLFPYYRDEFACDAAWYGCVSSTWPSTLTPRTGGTEWPHNVASFGPSQEYNPTYGGSKYHYNYLWKDTGRCDLTIATPEQAGPQPGPQWTSDCYGVYGFEGDLCWDCNKLVGGPYWRTTQQSACGFAYESCQTTCDYKPAPYNMRTCP